MSFKKIAFLIKVNKGKRGKQIVNKGKRGKQLKCVTLELVLQKEKSYNLFLERFV